MPYLEVKIKRRNGQWIILQHSGIMTFKSQTKSVRPPLQSCARSFASLLGTAHKPEENHVSDAPLLPSSLPMGGRPEVLSGCLFERRDVSAARVQPRLGPDGTRREAVGQACRAAFGVKGNLAEQIPLPARRAEPALNHHPRSGFKPTLA